MVQRWLTRFSVYNFDAVEPATHSGHAPSQFTRLPGAARPSIVSVSKLRKQKQVKPLCVGRRFHQIGRYQLRLEGCLCDLFGEPILIMARISYRCHEVEMLSAIVERIACQQSLTVKQRADTRKFRELGLAEDNCNIQVTRNIKCERHAPGLVTAVQASHHA